MEKPKNPRTAFFLFGAEHRQKLMENNPKMKVTDVARELGVLWKQCDENTKSKYVAAAENDKQRYEEEVRKFKEAGGDPVSLKRKTSASRRKQMELEASKSRKIKDPNAPKKPQSAFLLFCKENRSSIVQNNPQMKFGDIGRNLSIMWKNTDESTRKKYEELAVQEKSCYVTKLQEYKSSQPAVPEKKPKPATAFIIFGKDVRPQIKQQNPSISFADMGREISARWKSLDPESKKRYESIAKQQS